MGKYKKVFELFGCVILLLFLGVYFGQATGYYRFAENRKTTLTEEAIQRFEADVREGKEIIASNYLIKEKNYNNNISISENLDYKLHKVNEILIKNKIKVVTY